MKRSIPAFAILATAALVQVSLGYLLSVSDIRPGFMFITVYGLAVAGGEGSGMLYGAAGGLIMDCLSGGIPGLFMSGYAVVGYIAGRLGGTIFNIGEAANFVGIFALSLVHGIYTTVVLKTFYGDYGILHGMLRFGLPQALYNALAGSFILWFIDEEAASRHAWGGLVRRFQVRM